LYGQHDDKDPVAVVRAKNGKPGEPGTYLSLVAGLAPDRLMRAFIVRPGRTAKRGRIMSHHEGEEILFMLTGRIEGLPDSLTALSTTGILAGESEKAVGDWIDAAIGANLLAATDDAYRTLSLTHAGREVMAGRDAQVALTPPASPAPRAPRRRASKVLAAAARDAAATEPAAHADPARIEALRE